MTEQAGEAYQAFVKQQLDEERSTKNSLEQRGVFVITSAGALGTLLFGFASLAKRPEGLVLSSVAIVLLQAAAVLFVVSAVLGITVNWPRSYEEALPEELIKIINDDKAWLAPLSEGHQVVAEAQTKILSTAREVNRFKARFLTGAMAAEVLAVVAVAAALVLVVGA